MFCSAWFSGIKWIFLRIFSCIMKLLQYSSELRANTKCISRAFCFPNLKSWFDFTAVFQIITAKYNKNMVEQIQNCKYAGKDRFNLQVKTLTHYKNKEPRHRLYNLRYILSISKLVNLYPPETIRKPTAFWWLKGK